MLGSSPKRRIAANHAAAAAAAAAHALAWSNAPLPLSSPSLAAIESILHASVRAAGPAPAASPLSAQQLLLQQQPASSPTPALSLERRSELSAMSQLLASASLSRSPSRGALAGQHGAFALRPMSDAARKGLAILQDMQLSERDPSKADKERVSVGRALHDMLVEPLEDAEGVALARQFGRRQFDQFQVAAGNFAYPRIRQLVHQQDLAAERLYHPCPFG